MRSMVAYGSFLDATKDLDPEVFKKIWVDILEYGLDGTEPEPTDPVERGFFELIRPVIDNNKKRRKSTNDDNCEQLQTIADNCEHHSNDEDVEGDEEVDVEVKSKRVERAKRPTVEEVKAYCEERGNKVDPEAFVAYYDSQNWKKANGQPLTNWKSAVVTWEKRDREKEQTRNKAAPVKKNAFTAFEQRDYDFDALEKAVLA